MKGFVLLLALAAFPATAADLSKERSADLCVGRQIQLMGYPLSATLTEINAELQARGETCEPAANYAILAQQWIAKQQTAPPPPPERSWADRIRDASDAYLRMEQQRRANMAYPAPPPPPTTTTCQNTGYGMRCTTL